MTKFTNIYQEWIAAEKDTWFTTRSPHPEVPCHISPVKLPTYSNNSSYLTARSPIAEVKDYLEQQVLILKFNNPEHSPVMIKAAIVARLVHWRGNDTLKKDDFYLRDLLSLVIEACFNKECSLQIRSLNETKYWYSDEIMRMPADGSRTSDRYTAKLEARRAIISGGYKDDFRVATHEYKVGNFNVLPTVRVLSDNTRHSREIINIHGKEFVISQLDNTKQRVQKVREFYPELNQQKVAELLDLSLITVKRYWRRKEEVEVG